MIPIRNIYYLLLYAWDNFSEGAHIDVGRDDAPDLPNLLAKILVFGTRRQIGRGLEKGYASEIEELLTPKGKFLLAEAIKRNSLSSNRAICEFDQLNVDTIKNRILKASLRRLRLSPNISRVLADELRSGEARLDGVRSVPLSPSLFRSLQITRTAGHYGLLMKICRLVMDLSMPDRDGAGGKFSDILEDETRMSTVFENFVRNFYHREQSRYSVKSEMIAWPVKCSNFRDADYLPAMITDVTMRSHDRILVLDAKYYKEMFVSRLGAKPKVRSAHLYQLQSYLTNMGAKPDNVRAEGLLLYPSTNGERIRLDFQLPAHRIRVSTVDLAQQWQDVHRELLELLDPILQ